MRKVIFLDLDGVLNTERWHYQASQADLHDQYGYTFDPVAVANLAKIIDETGAAIVISSSWKFMGLAKLKKMWMDRGLPGEIFDITPNSVSDEFLLYADLDSMELLAIRGQEIKEWLMLHGKDVSHYVIIDDMDDILPEQQSHFVLTDPEVGISEWDAKRAIAILNRS